MTFVRYETSGQVVILTIDREKSLNALNRQVLADLAVAVEQAVTSRARALIITGAGPKAFVAGADIAEMSTLTRRQAQSFSEFGNACFRAIERAPIPSIAAVNGFALGGGCELALACDIRLASTQAQFGQPEVGLGITAGFGGTQRLARTVGIGVAKEMLYSGRRIDAARALAIGLVNAVVEPEELMAAALELANQIAAQAPAAVRATKQALAQGLAADIDSGIAIEALWFASCFETTDQREAMTAFTERRPAAPFQDN